VIKEFIFHINEYSYSTRTVLLKTSRES